MRSHYRSWVLDELRHAVSAALCEALSQRPGGKGASNLHLTLWLPRRGTHGHVLFFARDMTTKSVNLLDHRRLGEDARTLGAPNQSFWAGDGNWKKP